MARARNLKPSFFKSLQLAECQPLARLLFQALWCLSDKEGRLKDQPKLLKIECLPFDDCNVEQLLCELVSNELLIRYEVEGMKLIYIPNFVKHQNPHPKEQASELPEYIEEIKSRVISRQVPEINGEQQASNALPSPSLLLPSSFTSIPSPSLSTQAVEEPRHIDKPKMKVSKNGKLKERLDQYLEQFGGHPPEEWAIWCAAELHWDNDRISREWTAFEDYWLSADASGNGVKADWPATWRGWCRRQAERKSSPQRGYGGTRDSKLTAIGSEVLAKIAPEVRGLGRSNVINTRDVATDSGSDGSNLQVVETSEPEWLRG